jgi:hypothetical protein
MTLRLTIVFLVGSFLSATLTHAAPGPARSMGVMPHHFYAQRFRGPRIAHQFPSAGLVGAYAIGDLSGSDVEDVGPGVPVAPPSASTFSRAPAVADLPPCSETVPGGVTIMRGGTCAHRPVSP